MKSPSPGRLLPILLIICAEMLPAQWPKYMKPSVPKNPDGSVNLAGPVPRTADGKPDLSGIWTPDFPKRAAKTGAAADLGPSTSQFFNIGISFKDGLPFTPFGAEIRKRRMANESTENPDAHCLPLGVGQVLNISLHKFVQTPDQIVLLYEGASREIFTDGRPLPNNDPQPLFWGYSVGKWEGDTLVVQTIGFRDDGWLDVQGSPLTEKGKVTERFHRVDYGHMDTEFTVEDPKAYTKPWTVHVSNRLLPGEELLEFVCNDNEKDAVHYKTK
jgi:hypothetical protein